MSKPNQLSLVLSLLSFLMIALADNTMSDIALALLLILVVTLIATAGVGKSPCT